MNDKSRYQCYRVEPRYRSKAHEAALTCAVVMALGFVCVGLALASLIVVWG